MMADKDVAGVMGIFAEAMTTVVCTTIASTSRALPAAALAEVAADVFGAERVRTADDMAAAIEEAVHLADEAGPGAGVLIAGSVYAAGEARAMLVRQGDGS